MPRTRATEPQERRSHPGAWVRTPKRARDFPFRAYLPEDFFRAAPLARPAFRARAVRSAFVRRFALRFPAAILSSREPAFPPRRPISAMTRDIVESFITHLDKQPLVC